jgi:hypothetical protein
VRSCYKRQDQIIRLNWAQEFNRITQQVHNLLLLDLWSLFDLITAKHARRVHSSRILAYPGGIPSRIELAVRTHSRSFIVHRYQAGGERLTLSRFCSDPSGLGTNR